RPAGTDRRSYRERLVDPRGSSAAALPVVRHPAAHADPRTPTVMWRCSLLLLLLSAAPVFADQFDIPKPDVTHPRVVRSDITFQPGDEVIVHAGGCVNVGGGDWRDYVAPAGRQSDRLYHGRINIPGATAGLVRIGTVVERPPT